MSKAVSKKDAGSMAVPDHLKDRVGDNSGNENVGQEDIKIPMYVVVQALSPVCKKNDPSYIKEAEEGMLYNNVTKELVPEEGMMVIPLAYNPVYIIWGDRNAGGTFMGMFQDEESAYRALDDMNSPGAEVIRTAENLVLRIPEGRDPNITDIACLSMSRTKMKVARAWNSLIRMDNMPRWSSVYRVHTVPESNNKGDFYNFAVEKERWASKEEFALAEELAKTLNPENVVREEDPGQQGEEERF